MIVIGQKLTEVKALLQHGQFETWCSVEFDMSQRTAQRMMSAAEVFGGKSDTVSLLSDSVMYMLSGPSVPEAARVEVIEQAKATGESPTKAEVQAVIDKHKPDEELRDKCNKIEFWLMGKGWSGFGRKNEEGKLISGVQKGEHRFVWLDDDWADAYDKVRAAEKIERAAIAAFIKLTPPKSDTVSPLPKPPAPSPLTGAETRAMIWKALRENGPAKDANADPQECKAWLYRNGEPKDYIKFVPADRSIDQYTFNVEINMARTSLDADNRPTSPPDRPLPGWVADEPDPLMDEDEDNEPYTSAMVNLAERENKSSSSMATPTAVDLQLPSISIPDKDLFMSQVKRSVGVLSEEGYATVANFLRIVGRYAFDAQPAPLDAPEAPRADNGGQSREERIVGMTSILETALMLVVEDYGQLTGKWTHVAPAERALKQLIEVLKENLTK